MLSSLRKEMNSKLLLLLLMAGIAMFNFSFSFPEEVCKVDEDECCSPAEHTTAAEEVSNNCECCIDNAREDASEQAVAINSDHITKIGTAVIPVQNLKIKIPQPLISIQENIPLCFTGDIYLFNSNLRI